MGANTAVVDRSTRDLGRAVDEPVRLCFAVFQSIRLVHRLIGVYTIVAARHITIKMTWPGAYDQLIRHAHRKGTVRYLRRIGETTAKFNVLSSLVNLIQMRN